MKLFILFLFSLTKEFIPTPEVAHTLNQAYNNFWDGALGAKGYWGEVAGSNPNVFNQNFDKEDMKKIYKLDSSSPYAS